MAKLPKQLVTEPRINKFEKPEAPGKLIAATKPMKFKRKVRLNKVFKKERIIFCCINMLLLALIGYNLKWVAKNYRQSFLEPATSNIAPLPLANNNGYSENSIQPIEHYKGIWEGNLFKSSPKESKVPQKSDEALLKSSPLIQEDHGLELRGTVVASNSEQSYAVIFKRRENYQDIFKEGERVDNAVIKKIFRNKVIIDAGKGDELLALEFEQSVKTKLIYKIESASRKTPRVRDRKVSVDRNQFEAYLARLHSQWDRIQFTPHLSDGEPDGLKIKGMKIKNLLFEMGVRNGDVIKAINDQEYQSPDQAEDILENIGQGGEYTIKLLRAEKTPYILNVTVQ